MKDLQGTWPPLTVSAFTRWRIDSSKRWKEYFRPVHSPFLALYAKDWRKEANRRTFRKFPFNRNRRRFISDPLQYCFLRNRWKICNESLPPAPSFKCHATSPRSPARHFSSDASASGQPFFHTFTTSKRYFTSHARENSWSTAGSKGSRHSISRHVGEESLIHESIRAGSLVWSMEPSGWGLPNGPYDVILGCFSWSFWRWQSLLVGLLQRSMCCGSTSRSSLLPVLHWSA